jgi:hypothetical protein
MLKSQNELKALPERKRLRYLALMAWGSTVVGVLFGLQIAYVEGFRLIGLGLVLLALLTAIPAIMLTRRAVIASRHRE